MGSVLIRGFQPGAKKFPESGDGPPEMLLLRDRRSPARPAKGEGTTWPGAPINGDGAREVSVHLRQRQFRRRGQHRHLSPEASDQQHDERLPTLLHNYGPLPSTCALTPALPRVIADQAVKGTVGLVLRTEAVGPSFETMTWRSSTGARWLRPAVRLC